jgi:polyferredoxin
MAELRHLSQRLEGDVASIGSTSEGAGDDGMIAQKPAAGYWWAKIARRFKRRLDFLPRLRVCVQGAFGVYLLLVGWQFSRFVAHFLSGGANPYVDRPPAVEGFLPVSALVALKSWLGTGVFDAVHPAGLVILLTIGLTSALFKKSFCAWICPIGTVAEGLARLGRRFFGRNLAIPSLLDWPLRGMKYLLLAFFLYAILLGMSVAEATVFLRTPYNLVADVKMLQFFAPPAPEVLAFLIALAVLSALFSNFWCRYLCPYGALLGLLSLASPLKVTRDPVKCNGCGMCTRACPNRIEVAKLDRVESPECSGCLGCVAACRRKGALGLALPWGPPTISPWVLPAMMLGVFFAAVVVAQLTGHWQTVITYQDYARLVPAASTLSH